MPARPFMISVCLAVISQMGVAHAQGDSTARNGATTPSPTRGWIKDRPEAVGLDGKVLAAFDADLASGKYSLVDSFAVYRCGKMVFEQTFPTTTRTSTQKRRASGAR